MSYNIQELFSYTFNFFFAFPYGFVWFFALFGILARLMACNPKQPLLRQGMLTDIAYWIIVPIFSRYVNIAFLSIGFGLIFYNIPPEEMGKYFENGYGYLSTLPLWLQAALVFVISDFILYWTHRFFHGRELWKYHAIHHSPTEVDWLSTYRFHPINVWLSFSLVNVLMLLVGFSPESIAVMGGFNTLYSAMVHANLNWTFGKLRYIFASPVFHRWHHTVEKEAMNKNFAPTFPLLDVMFGTFYMPEGRLPENYGITNSDVPQSFIGQIIYPFKK